MKKALICFSTSIFLLQLQLIVSAQYIRANITGTTATTKTYSFDYKTPAEYPACMIFDPVFPTKRASLFMEFGDGNFGVNDCTFSNTYIPAAGASMRVLLKATGIYDGGPRPKRFFTTIIPGISTLNRNNGFPVMPDSVARIKITANSDQIIAEDEAVFAITFKRAEKGELIFFYESPSRSIFEEINSSRIIQAYKENEITEDFMAIRTYNNASISTSPPSTAAQNVIDNNSTQFSKHLLFLVPANTGPGLTQKNIFITLPVKRGTAPGLNAAVKAVFVSASGSLEDKMDLVTVSSRDPNNIEAYPACVPLDPTSTIFYTVNFQNIGNAPARDVVITADLPQEILTSQGFSLAAFVKGKRINRDLTIPSNGCSGSGYNYWITATGQVKIRICDARLKGTRERRVDETLTRGYLLVKAKVNPIYFIPGTSRIMRAVAGIKFDNNPIMVTDPAYVFLKKYCFCEKEYQNGDSTRYNRQQ